MFDWLRRKKREREERKAVAVHARQYSSDADNSWLIPFITGDASTDCSSSTSDSGCDAGGGDCGGGDGGGCD